MGGGGLMERLANGRHWLINAGSGSPRTSKPYHGGLAPKLLFIGGTGEGQDHSEGGVGRSFAVRHARRLKSPASGDRRRVGLPASRSTGRSKANFDRSSIVEWSPPWER
jgi:hypothetical protein